MKQKHVKHIATVLVALLFILPLSLGSSVFAADENTISAGETKSVTIAGRDSTVLQFTPLETGYYEFSSVDAAFTSFNLLDENDEFLNSAYGYISSASNTERDLLYFCEAGKTYYLKVYNVIWGVPTNITYSIAVSLAFLGELESVAIITWPQNTTYIYGIDAFNYEDAVLSYFERTPEDLLNDPAVPDYIKEDVLSYQNGEIEFNSNGIEIKTTFSGGGTKTYTDEDGIFATPKAPIALGNNTLVLTLDNCITIDIDVTVIENPVESIEIIYMPDIGPIYVDWADFALGNEALETYFTEIPPYGTQIQIKYTDGTSKMITVDRYADLYDVDGYPMYTDIDYDQTDEDTLVFTLEYLGHTTSYSVEYSFNGSLYNVISILSRIAEIFNQVLTILMNLTGFSLYY